MNPWNRVSTLGRGVEQTPIPKDMRGMPYGQAFPMQDYLDNNSLNPTASWWKQPNAPMFEDDVRPIAAQENVRGWGEVVPDEKRPVDRGSGLPAPILNPWERARQPNRIGFYNPQTGDRTLEQFASDVANKKLSWPQVEEAMKTLPPDEKRTLYLDMLSHPGRERYQDIPPIGEGKVWRKQKYRDYET